jgi:serine/threonine protein phosphatase PrpC
VRVGQTGKDTDPGRKRRHNEDSFVCRPPLFAIADGMGGAQAGEVASALAAGALRDSAADGGGEQRVRELIQEANRRVHERATTDASTSGLGTTMTVALFDDDGTVSIGHVGDSRAYLLRDGLLEQLTTDHSLVAELVRRGELSPQEAEVHPQRSVITRALGTDPKVDIDTFSVAAKAGDVYLICSDGLSDMLPTSRIENIVRSRRDDLGAAAKALVHAANRAGGDDNITVVLFEVAEGALPGDGTVPDERTKEYATRPFDEDDTLHPEDAVRPPPPAAEPVGADAVPPDAVETGVAEPVDTMIVRPGELGPAAAPAVPAAEPESPAAGLGRHLLALAVILGLVVLIVFLVWWGLAR